MVAVECSVATTLCKRLFVPLLDWHLYKGTHRNYVSIQRHLQTATFNFSDTHQFTFLKILVRSTLNHFSCSSGTSKVQFLACGGCCAGCLACRLHSNTPEWVAPASRCSAVVRNGKIASFARKVRERFFPALNRPQKIFSLTLQDRFHLWMSLGVVVS